MMRIAFFFGLMLALHQALEVRAFAQNSQPEQAYRKGALDESDESFASRATTPTYRAFLPTSVDLSRYFPSPGDQGKQSSCVGWAVGYAARAYYAILQGQHSWGPHDIPSPAYIYNSILSTPGHCDAGAHIPDAFELLKVGVLSISEAPYDAKRCMRPNMFEKGKATAFRISTWFAVNPAIPDQIKGELAQGHPVIISIISRASLEGLRGDLVYQAKNEPNGDSHALTVVGYDERRQAFKVINSWGAAWGAGGYGWIGYATFVKDVRRAYVMRPAQSEKPDSPNPPAPQPTPLPQPAPIEPKNVFDFVKCGLVTTRSTSAGLEVSGFVGTLLELRDVEAKAAEMKAAVVRVSIHQWPQCEALMTLKRGLKVSDRPKVRVVRSGDAPLEVGSPLVIEVESPASPSFLHVTYIQADGKAVHLIQPEALTLSSTPGHTKRTLGGTREGGPTFTVSAPVGDELVIAVSSKAPLFADKRPTIETEREFLTALRAAVVAQPDAASPRRLFAADFDAVKTMGKK